MFTARQAALLIMGVDPNSEDAQKVNPEHVLLRLSHDCTVALMRAQAIASNLEDADDLWPERYCLNFNELRRMDVQSVKARDLFVDDLTFNRADLVNWQAKNNLPSAYNFERTSGCKWFEPIIPVDGKPLTTRERNSLLTIIGLLCAETKLDHTKAAAAATVLKNRADMLGVKIGETTIENHLKAVAGALDIKAY